MFVLSCYILGAVQCVAGAVMQEKQEAGWCFFLWTLNSKENIFRFALSYCISARCCPCQARSRLLLFSLDVLIKKIYSGSCCASAYLSGAPLREEKEENSGQR